MLHIVVPSWTTVLTVQAQGLIGVDMVDHTIEAHFKVSSSAQMGRSKEDLLVARMVDVLCSGNTSPQARMQAEQVARAHVKLVKAYNEAIRQEGE